MPPPPPVTPSVLDPQRPVYTPTEDDSPNPFGGAQTTQPPVTPPLPMDNSSVTPGTPESTIVNANSGGSGGGGKKKVLAVLGVVLTIVGVGSGVFLVRNQQLGNTSAWDCSRYTFALSNNGTVTVTNGSTLSETPQQAKVYINNNLVNTFNVPSLVPGQGATLGTVSVPTNASYTWRIDGTVDCENAGNIEIQNQLVAECANVQAYDENWLPLNAAQLSQRKEGDIVRFTISGATTGGIFTKARFTVNGGVAQEVTTKKPGTEEFYYEYTIPAGTLNFSVGAQIYHDQLGWI